MRTVAAHHRAPSRASQALLLVGATTFVLAPFLLYVWSHVQIVTTGYRIEATESRIGALEQANRTLRLERSRLSAPPLVEERARKLGFVPVAPGRIVRLVAASEPEPELPPLPGARTAPAPAAAATAERDRGATR